MKKVINYFHRHAVSIVMVLTTLGFIIGFDHIDPIYKPHLFFVLPFAFMVRGIMWEEAYWQQAVRQQAKIDYLQMYTGKTGDL